MKNRHCPAFRFCRDDCTDCEHSIRYNRLHGKVKRQKAKIDNLEKRLEEEKHALFEQQAYTAKLQAEIEKLKRDVDEAWCEYTDLQIDKDEMFNESVALIKNAGIKAIKEFAERMKASLDGKTDPVDEYDIDFLVEEMTEEQE